MPKQPLCILCFGNSLTAGYPPGQPYAEKLKEKLEAALQGHSFSRVEYEVDGVPGDLVTTGSFVDRMRANCQLFSLPVQLPICFSLYVLFAFSLTVM